MKCGKMLLNVKIGGNEMDVIQKKLFMDINLQDSFFNSLREDYQGFDNWYNRKAKEKQFAYILEDGGIQGFLYIKEENEEDSSIRPKLNCKRRLKVGTFKINAHGTKLGERFIKIIIDEMFKNNFEEVYVTIFQKHKGLINLLQRYGFLYYGEKGKAPKIENVYMKYSNIHKNDILLDYPKIDSINKRKFMLSILPKFHTRMFPDSKLKTEKDHAIKDIPVTNSIEKIYLSGVNLSEYRRGDIVVIYRTCEPGQIAEYTSVATSICVVEEVKNINDFGCYNEFYDYCSKHSVFTDKELQTFWKTKKYPYLIKMLYNIALDRRPIRKKLIEEVGLSRGERWVAVSLTDSQLKKILELGEINESFIID